MNYTRSVIVFFLFLSLVLGVYSRGYESVESQACSCVFDESNMICSTPYPVNYPIPSCCDNVFFNLNITFSVIQLNFSTSTVRFASYDLGANCSFVKVRIFTPHHETYPPEYFVNQPMNCSNLTVGLNIYDFPYTGAEFIYRPLCGGIQTVSCKGSHPGQEFVCKEGIWVGVSVNSTMDIQLSGPSYVLGNITTPSLEFNNYINVTGCLNVENIKYRPSEITTNKTLILSQDKQCPYDPKIDVVVFGLSSNQSCKIVSSKITGSSSLYLEMFLVDDPECRSKLKKRLPLIIGLSMGAVVLVIAILVILTMFYKPFRRFVRPFTIRSEQHK